MVGFIFLIGLSAPIPLPSHHARSQLPPNTKLNALRGPCKFPVSTGEVAPWLAAHTEHEVP